MAGLKPQNNTIIVGQLGNDDGMSVRRKSGGGGSSGPTPVFDVDPNSSIVPIIGTAGTFARASMAYYFTSGSTLATVASGNPAIGAFNNYVSTTKGGIFISDAIKNWLQYSEQFDQAPWAVNGTGSITANQINAPDGGVNTADQISGSAANDGVQQNSGAAAASFGITFYVWLKANSGSRSVDIIVKDQAGSPASSITNCTVTSTWKLFSVFKQFAAGATGNVVCEIKVNDTTGYSIYGWGAQLSHWNPQVTAGKMGCGYDLVAYVPTTNAVASKVADSLYYQGAEITTAYAQCTLAGWVYLPNWDYNVTHYGNPYLVMLSDWATVQQIGFEIDSGGLLIVKFVGGAGNIARTQAQTDALKHTWFHLAVCADYTADTYEAILNGVSIYTDTTARASPVRTDLVFGGLYRTGTYTRSQFVFGRTQLYNTKLDVTAVAAIYNAQKGDYGL